MSNANATTISAGGTTLGKKKKRVKSIRRREHEGERDVHVRQCPEFREKLSERAGYSTYLVEYELGVEERRQSL